MARPSRDDLDPASRCPTRPVGRLVDAYLNDQVARWGGNKRDHARALLNKIGRPRNVDEFLKMYVRAGYETMNIYFADALLVGIGQPQAWRTDPALCAAIEATGCGDDEVAA